ncbi:PEP-CTERM/exosortase system-associated acyltransferase [Halomonas sp. YLGW01]|uniref:PEP-CTERM/exosortase system-associated acyltransferase n=1 Tax=Halomonas sp. YLGW01 TaxID=2773308 RepID=UPI00177BC0AA|nr:PEP-CTERM/exosortase system-associated acyltransferase [Halomonas sp. YLGW01]
MDEKIDGFINQFQVNIANTKKEKETLRRLRHEIFIEELEYQLKADEKRKLEHDHFDDAAIHCFITHKRTGLIAGCMRLVLPFGEGTLAPALPLEDFCSPLFKHPTYYPQHFPHEKVCEVSRFAIPRIFRNKSRQSNCEGQQIEFHKAEVALFPMIMIGLFLATFALVGLTGRPHVFALMQPNLPRALSFSGFHFTRITDIFEYFGTRGAYYINHQRASNEFKRELAPLYRHIKHQIRDSLPDEYRPASHRSHEALL